MSSPRLHLDLNRQDYFAQKGTIIITDRGSLANLDDRNASPVYTDRSPHLSPRNRQPTSFHAVPSNNVRYPPTIIKPEIAGFGYYQEGPYSYGASPTIKPSPRYQPNYPDSYGIPSPHSLSRVPSQSYAPTHVIKPIQSMQSMQSMQSVQPMQPNVGPVIPVVYSKSHPTSMQNVNFDYQIRQPTYQQPKYQQPSYQQPIYTQPAYPYKSDLDRKFEEQYKKLNKIASDFNEQFTARQKISQLKLDTELRQLEMMKYSERFPEVNKNRQQDRMQHAVVPGSHRQSPVSKKMYTEESYQPEQRRQKVKVRYQLKSKDYDAERNYYEERRERMPTTVQHEEEEESPYFETVKKKPKHQVYRSVNMGDSREVVTRSRLKPRTYVGPQATLDDDDDDDPVPVKSFRIRAPSKQEDRRRAIQVINPAAPFDTKKKIKLRLRAFTWTLLYSILLRNSVKQKVLVERDGFLQNISQNISSIYGLLETFIKQTAGFHIEKLLTSKKPGFIFLSNKKPLSESKMEAECSALINDLKTMISNLVLNIKTLSTYFYTLLATLSEEGSLVPNDYFTEFELKRQQFSYFGKLKFITPERSKFIIGGLILRVFIHKILMKPWEFFSLESSKFDHERLLNIGSIIYNIMMDVLRDLAPPFEDNQSFLPVELKVRPKKMLAQALEIDYNSANMTKPAGKGKEEIIEGFYTKEQLSFLFNDRKKQIDEVKKWFNEWLDRFYENSHKEMVKALENQNT